MNNQKPLLDDIFNFGGVTEDGLYYDGWEGEPAPKKDRTGKPLPQAPQLNSSRRQKKIPKNQDRPST